MVNEKREGKFWLVGKSESSYRYPIDWGANLPKMRGKGVNFVELFIFALRFILYCMIR